MRGLSVSIRTALIASLVIVACGVAALMVGTEAYIEGAAAASQLTGTQLLVSVARAALWRVFGSTASVGAVILLALWWMLDDVVGGRIRALSDEVDRLARGDAARRLDDRSQDELGDLVARFNQMSKQLEQWRRETRRREHQLEESLEEKTRELRRLNNELARTWQDRVQHEKLLSLGRMAAGVAHEIRNPLNAIGLTVAYLQDEFLPSDGEAQAKFKELTTNIQNETKRLEGLVRRFLDFSTPARPRLRYNDVHGALNDVVTLVQEEASRDAVRVVTDYGHESVWTMMDPERMREAFWNVIINAIQAMPGGGELKITSRVDLLGEAVELGFADSGVGIPEGDIEKVFDPYYTTKDKGVGLGLAIVRRIVEDHGGRVAMTSKVGEGTTLTIRLPIRGDVTGARREGARTGS